jgi:hypothetical protein
MGPRRLHLPDLLTLLAVRQTGSLSGAARDERATPSQVGKAIDRVERHFGARRFGRGARVARSAIDTEPPPMKVDVALTAAGR